jgi:hypothetical protein
MAKEEEWEEFTRNLGGGLKAIRSAKAMGREVLAMGKRVWREVEEGEGGT